uniref:Uncharacterized protein n=1 Tax=Arundo donax TaxID=35708 RepID=A0A0A9EUI3_ARUDO
MVSLQRKRSCVLRPDISTRPASSRLRKLLLCPSSSPSCCCCCCLSSSSHLLLTTNRDVASLAGRQGKAARRSNGLGGRSAAAGCG